MTGLQRMDCSTTLRQAAAMESLETRSVGELLALHVGVMERLRSLGVVRSANNPTGDLAEFLFCAAFGWRQEANSAKAFDATDSAGLRYQIKGRRVHRRNPSRQLSAIRSLEGFDHLAAVLFDDNYAVKRGAIIPVATVAANATYVEHTNSHKFLLRDSIWEIDGVLDVTDKLADTFGALGSSHVR